MSIRSRISVALLCGLASVASAEHRPSQLAPNEIAVLQTSFFAQAHPDIRFRLSALSNIEAGLFSAAFGDLKRAARYGDKASQAIIAEAYWLGTLGQARNPSLGYAWMDLAAERGYPLLLAKREAYWSELDDDSRARAIEHGTEVYAEFGDAVALDRLDSKFRFAKMHQTGSRLGAGKVQSIIADGSIVKLTAVRALGSSMHISASGGKRVDLWNPNYWNLDRYIAWKAVELDGELTGLGKGEVEVLPITPQNGQL